MTHRVPASIAGRAGRFGELAHDLRAVLRLAPGCDDDGAKAGQLDHAMQGATGERAVAATHEHRVELEVLKLVAGGLSNQAIAEQLVVGETTVRTHVSSILGKLQLASRTQAALYALREGYALLDTTRAPD